MLVAAACCPHPPLLVPAVAQGATAELDGLRSSCAKAVDALFAATPVLLVVVGGGPRLAEYAGDSAGSLTRYGIDVRYGGYGPVVLPLAHTVGAYLLGDATVVRRYVAVPDTASAESCAALGRELAGRAERVALLAMGDGSARHPGSPLGHDARAVAFDAETARALASADTSALDALDPLLARDLVVSGRAPWQVLAGAAHGLAVSASLLDAATPYGIGYLVASWVV